jgi:hypothetical protein
LPKPEVSEEALYGILGDITRWIGPQTEADPVAIYSQMLVTFGNYIGRDAYFQVEQTKHHANLFVTLVGRTSRGRKGTSLDYVTELFKQADPLYQIQTTGGLSTGEGLIWNVRDPIVKTEYNRKSRCSETVQVDDGVSDKRLLVVETEFARTLRAMARHGNTLSAVLRRAWDDGDLRTMTKNEAARATGAHVSMIDHITEDELARTLLEDDPFNGFANRFIWPCVARARILPDGGSLDPKVFTQWADKLAEVLGKAAAVREMRRDEDAKRLWHDIYGSLSADWEGLLGAVTSRAEAQVLRISMINALTDGSPEIRVPHLKAALAFWDYCLASARKLFGGKLSDTKAQRILDELKRRHPAGMTRTEISEEIFGRHEKSTRIDLALQLLARLKLASSKNELTDGRTIERWVVNLSA